MTPLKRQGIEHQTSLFGSVIRFSMMETTTSTQQPLWLYMRG
jgi:hypothetical protein